MCRKVGETVAKGKISKKNNKKAKKRIFLSFIFFGAIIGSLSYSFFTNVGKIVESEKRKQQLIISSGSELWEKRKQLYPHLVFCESVKKQLEEARVSIQIQTIMKRIQILEDYFATYDGEFDKSKVGYGCRNESETVKNDRDLKECRKFLTPFGKEDFFYWHISFAGNYPGRIHFLPDAEHKVGIIGYIGKHLPTKKYSTI